MDSPAIRDSTVLVTGGAGFIGSHLVEALTPHNEVRVLDNLTTGDRTHLPDGVTVIEGDIRDPIALQQAARGVDVIFHHAALVSVERSVDAPRQSNRIEPRGESAGSRAGPPGGRPGRRCLERGGLRPPRRAAGHRNDADEPDLALRRPEARARPVYPPLRGTLRSADRRVALFQRLWPAPAGPYSGVISTFLEQARAGEPITVEGTVSRVATSFT